MKFPRGIYNEEEVHQLLAAIMIAVNADQDTVTRDAMENLGAYGATREDRADGSVVFTLHRPK